MASNNESAYESTCKAAIQDDKNQDDVVHLDQDVVQRSVADDQAHRVAKIRARLDEDMEEQKAKSESWEWWHTERCNKRKQASEDRACQRSRVRAEAKLAKAATKAEASATPKDDMSAPIGAASNVEGGCARRAPDLEAFSVAMEDAGPDGDGGGKVQTNAAPDTDAHGETEAFAGAAEASEPAIGLGVGQCLCKGVCECLQVTTSVDEEGSPMTTMARLAVRGGGSGAPVPLDDGVQVKAEPGTRGVVGAPVPPGDGVQVKMEPGTRRNEGPPVSGDEVIFLESTDDEGCPELIGEQG